MIMLTVLLVFFYQLGLFAYTTSPETKMIELEEIESLILNVKFGIGELNLGCGESDVFVGNFLYGNGLLNPQINYHVLEKKGMLDLSQSINKDVNLFFSVQNVWDLELPANIPLKINLNTATYKGNIDLTNLAVEDLSLISGASRTIISCNQINQACLKKITLKTGASTLTMEGLANLNFDNMYFDGGAGLYIFDFSGYLRKKSKIKINVGASKVILKIPTDLSAKIKLPKILTLNADLEDFIEVNDQIFVTHIYGKREEDLDIEINGAFLNVEMLATKPKN